MRVEDLLHPTHPLERLHQRQVQQLRELSAGERASKAQLLRIGNAAYRYHQLAQDRLTEADFAHWLVGLPARMQQAMATAGLEAACSSWAFRRHVLERHDVGYVAFTKELLSAKDWAFCQQKEQEEPPVQAQRNFQPRCNENPCYKYQLPDLIGSHPGGVNWLDDLEEFTDLQALLSSEEESSGKEYS